MTRRLSQSKRNRARRRYYARNRTMFREYNRNYYRGNKKQWWLLACLKAGVPRWELEGVK